MATALASSPTEVIVAVGTYDGVLAGWEWKAASKNRKFKIAFATPAHQGSVRGLSLAQRQNTHNATDQQQQQQQQQLPGTLVSCGYDEILRTHDFAKRLTSSGEIRTPSDLGTPVCVAFAPPFYLSPVPSSSNDGQHHTTHCLVGFAAGQLVIYKKRDWSVQHILKGHEGGVTSMAVHPTGSMALSGGTSDGKLKLWDLTKGRLSYNHKIIPSRTTKEGKTFYDAIQSIIWTTEAYGFCYGNHLTVKDIASGIDLLDVELPSKVNQICFLQGPEGLFLAAANNDGSLAVLHVGGENDQKERRAIMAIEPVEGPVAGEERFKCLQQVADYHVVTANSAGVVSLMDLSGAVRMIMADDIVDDDNDNASGEDSNDDEEKDSDAESEDGEEELAVNIIDSVQLGTGNRVTCLAAWSTMTSSVHLEEDSDKEEDSAESADGNKEETPQSINDSSSSESDKDDRKRKLEAGVPEIMDSSALERARDLVASAKKIREKRQKKKSKKKKTKQ